MARISSTTVDAVMTVSTHDDTEIDMVVEYDDGVHAHVIEFDGKEVIIEMMKVPAARAYMSRWFQ